MLESLFPLLKGENKKKKIQKKRKYKKLELIRNVTQETVKIMQETVFTEDTAIERVSLPFSLPSSLPGVLGLVKPANLEGGDAEAQAPAPFLLQVRWGCRESGASWLRLLNPFTGAWHEIRARGLNDRDKWIFERVPSKPRTGPRFHFDYSPEDARRTEAEAECRVAERDRWDEAAIAEMKKMASTMVCALCRQPVSVDFITGLCEECQDR